MTAIRRPIVWALLALAAASVHAACGGGGSALRSDLPTSGSAGGSSGTPSGSIQLEGVDNDVEWDVHACSRANLAGCVEHAKDVKEAFDALMELEATGDVRVVPTALDAFASPDAEIRLLAIRVLGAFPREPGVAKTVASAMLDPRPVIRAMAAQLLQRSEETAHLAKQYATGHSQDDLSGVDASEHDPKVDPKTWGHVAYPAAARFFAGDSLVSLGYATTASVEDVAAFYAKQPGARRMSASEFAANRKAGAEKARAELEAASRAMAQAAMSGGRVDPKAMEKMQEMAKTLADASEQDRTPYPPEDRLASAVFFELEAKNGRVLRWAAVYREPLIDRTAIVLSWSAFAYATQRPMIWRAPSAGTQP